MGMLKKIGKSLTGKEGEEEMVEPSEVDKILDNEELMAQIIERQNEKKKEKEAKIQEEMQKRKEDNKVHYITRLRIQHTNHRKREIIDLLNTFAEIETQDKDFRVKIEMDEEMKMIDKERDEETEKLRKSMESVKS